MNKTKLEDYKKTAYMMERFGSAHTIIVPTDLTWLLDRAEKCDELEAKCKVYEDALKPIAQVDYHLQYGKSMEMLRSWVYHHKHEAMNALQKANSVK